MNKLLLSFLVIILFACNSKEPDYDHTIVSVHKKIDSIDTVDKKPYSFEKAAPTVIDPELKKKMLDAFALLKKYANETKIVPKNAKDRVIHVWKKISFGKSKLISSGGIEFSLEKNLVGMTYSFFLKMFH